jgi:putative thioredoxin
MATSPIVFDATDADFEQQVIEASAATPIVVDLWAPWCAPCRSLGPILERVVESYGGRVRLAKVNVDENPGIAAAFRVQGIPAVKILAGGRIATEFTGALPEAEVRRIIDLIVPSEADGLVAEADRLLEAGDRAASEQKCRQVLDAQPDHPGAALRLARFALEAGDADAARDLASRVAEGTPEYDEAQAILARFEFAQRCAASGGKDACAQRLEQNPDDLDARYDLACCLAAEGAYQDALEEFLAVLPRDKTFREGAAKEAMVRIFGIVGQRSPLADTYRDRLASLLY